MRPGILAQALGVRGRVLLLGLLPLVLMALLLGYHLIDSRLEDSRRVSVERGSLMVRYLALVSEFGLFWQDREVLDSVVEGMVFDEDVAWAAVLDHGREVVAHAGEVSSQELTAAFTAAGLERYSPALFMVPIGVLASPLLDFGKVGSRGGGGDDDWPLGWAVVRLSLDRSLEHQRNILLGSLLLISGGLLLSLAMALWVGRSITRPVLNLTQTVDNLRRGDLSARVEVRSDGELGHLETGFNEMAYALQQAQEHLEQQVEAATWELQETVAHLRSSNEKLHSAREQALQAGREKEEFLARMSHEIRTPLNAVIGFSRLLNDRPDVEGTREYTRTIDLAANQLLFLVDGILQFSRLESGNIELECIEYDLPTCLEDAVAMLSTAAHDKGLELALQLHSDLPARVCGDPNRVSQIVINLLNNAIKFTDSGHVFVEAGYGEGEKGPEVCVQVSDTGIGLSEEEGGRLFHAFSQADSSVTRRFGGSGLGLAISKSLVSLMGGSIGVRSEKSLGSVFHFSIPCRVPADPLLEEPGPFFAGRRVLLYDAKPVSRRTLRTTFLRWHMTVFNSGEFEQMMQLLAADAEANTPCDLLLLGLSPEESVAERFPTLFCRVRDLYEGPVLALAPSQQWRPPPPMDQCPRIAWGSKPARRSTLEHKICELLKIECSAADQASVEPSRTLPFAGLHILSAEDNEFNRLLLRRLLEEGGARVHETHSGHEVVKAAQQADFDLILMDIHMPGLDGIEAARRIRAGLGRHCPPIVALTADLFVGTGEGVEASLFDEHLTKPVIAEALEATIARRAGGIPRGGTAPQPPPARPASRQRPERGAEFHPLLPPELVASLYGELNRLCAELERLQGRAGGEEFADLAHQLLGLAGLYGLEELAAGARELERAARNGDAGSALQRLAAIVASLPPPVGSDSRMN